MQVIEEKMQVFGMLPTQLTQSELPTNSPLVQLRKAQMDHLREVTPL